MIDTLEDLEKIASSRIKGLINVLRVSPRKDDRIIAFASILKTLQKKGIKYTEHFVNHCLLYLFEEKGWKNEF